MAQKDQFPSRSAGASPREWFAITPDDDVDLEQIPQAIWVGTGGNIALMGSDGNVEIKKNVQSGYHLIASPVRVMETGTTAQDLIGDV